MIVYQMGCANGHSFEGWFASAEACEEQADSGVLTCPTCSSAKIRKMLSAPHVHTGDAAPAVDAATREKAVEALRTMVLTSTEDVGRKFAEIARRIHYKEEAPRNIRGRVTADEAQELREEGVDTLTLPPGIVPDSDEIH